jgi:hypothetical protein
MRRPAGGDLPCDCEAASALRCTRRRSSVFFGIIGFRYMDSTQMDSTQIAALRLLIAITNSELIIHLPSFTRFRAPPLRALACASAYYIFAYYVFSMPRRAESPCHMERLASSHVSACSGKVD